MNKDLLPGKLIHRFFEVTILVKGFNGIWEIVTGFLFLFFKNETIYNAIIIASNQKIFSGSENFANHYLTRQADNFSSSTQYFIAIYFLFYGIINIFLVISLLKGKLWAYPAAILFFLLFIVYQCYRLYLRHSGLLLFLTIFDAFLVALTFLEYKRVKGIASLDTVP